MEFILSVWWSANWGNVVSLLGLGATLFGFWITLVTLFKTRTAAEAARTAAEGARVLIYKVDVITVCTDILARFEEVKMLHRDGSIGLLPSRYSEARSLLATANAVARRLSLEAPRELEDSLRAFEHFENKIDIFVEKGVKPDFVKFNRELNTYGRGIKRFVEDLKARGIGEENS